jgi:hypothetical protein
MSSIHDDIKVQDRALLTLHGGGGGGSRGGGGQPSDPTIRVCTNIDLTLRNRPGGRIVEKRSDHNIFLDYGREWISELIALQPVDVYFRTDRIAYMAFGIGGTRQRVASATLRATTGSGYGYTGFPDDWTAPSGTAGSGSPTADPAQTDVDPTVTGLEYPVEVTSGDYYDDISQPATFPQPGIVRFTAVVGYTEISFGTYTSVPLSEIGLFTQAVSDTWVPAGPGRGDAPLPSPPARYMVAYNTFDTLHKTSAYVLQIDWELRFS